MMLGLDSPKNLPIETALNFWTKNMIAGKDTGSLYFVPI